MKTLSSMRDAFTDEGVAGNLAALADGGVFLNLDKGADFRFVANLTAIKVDELGKLDILPQLHVGCDAYDKCS